MSNSKPVRSLWHSNCKYCETILRQANFPAVGNSVNRAITALYYFVEAALDTALLDYFNDPEESYYSMLERVDKIFATSPERETDKCCAAVKLLQDQHVFYCQYGTFLGSQPGVIPPTVEILQTLTDSMKIVANRLGLNECAKKIGFYLYDPEGEETQDIFGGPTFVPRDCCTTYQHIQMSKLAAFFAHPPPDPEVQKFLDEKYGGYVRAWNTVIPSAVSY